MCFIEAAVDIDMRNIEFSTMTFSKYKASWFQHSQVTNDSYWHALWHTKQTVTLKMIVLVQIIQLRGVPTLVLMKTHYTCREY